MDREVVEQKLESLRRAIRRIEWKCPQNAADLASDIDLQDILSLNLSRAVQLTVDIGAHLVSSMELPAPDTMGQTFDLLREAGIVPAELASNLRKAVGFRNIAVHNYEKIDWNIVHSIAKKRIDDFREFARLVTLRLQD